MESEAKSSIPVESEGANRQPVPGAKRMKRVLIVDDDYDICEAVQLLLESQYEVAVAYNGEQALARLEKDAFDAIVLDLMMPVMDGESLFAELRRRGEPPPVIFASAAQHLPSRARKAGAAAFLQKPFDARQLESTLANVVGNSAAVAH